MSSIIKKSPRKRTKMYEGKVHMPSLVGFKKKNKMYTYDKKNIMKKSVEKKKKSVQKKKNYKKKIRL